VKRGRDGLDAIRSSRASRSHRAALEMQADFDMWMRRAGSGRTFVASVALASVAFGCLSRAPIQPQTGEEHLTPTLTGYEIMGPYVPAGTMFTAALLEEVPRADRTFRASIREPLRGPDGTIVVRRGAVVEGHTEDVSDGEVVVLTHVRMLEGLVPVSARLVTPLPAPARPGTIVVVELDGPLVPPASSYR